MYQDFRALDPSKYLDEVSPGRTATIVVAASNSSLQSRAQADYVCDGVNDQVEIQAALDALPATGGEVKLLEGTYNVEDTVWLNSNQTLKGCGWNTILTTSTADVIFLIAPGGGPGAELTGIVIADLQIDGGVGYVSDCGIYFNYVNYSIIRNVYSRRHASGTGTNLEGIYLVDSNFNQIVNNTCQENYAGIEIDYGCNNTIVGNTCQGNFLSGIVLYLLSSNNTITGNTCQGGGGSGIELNTLSNGNTVSGNTCQGNGAMSIRIFESNDNTITGNTCRGNNGGIYLDTSNHNTVSGNTCQGNGADGIYLLDGNNNTVTGNTFVENGQLGDNTYDNICLNFSSYNLILGNLCRAPTVGTTLTTGESAGATNIHVTDTTGFEVGNGVVLDLGGANEEYHRITLIAAGAPGLITIDAPLANDQGAGETIDMPEARYGINIVDNSCTENVVKENDLYDSGKTAAFNDAGIGTKLAVYVVPFSDGFDPQDSGFLIDADTEYARAWLRLPDKVVQVVRMKVYARSVALEADKMRGEFVIYGGADNEAYNVHNGSVANHPSTSANFAADDVIFWTIVTAGVLALLGGDSVEVKVLHEAAGGADCATNAYLRTVEIGYV